METTITTSDMAKITRKLQGIKGGVKKAVSRATTRTASTGKTHISKEIRSELAVKAKDVNQVLTNRRIGSGRKIELKKTIRLPLKAFSPRQTKKGVSYRTNKSGGRKSIPGAFISQKMGGHVFKRRSKARTDLYKPKGASPWGAFVKNDNIKPTLRLIKKTFKKRLEHEVNFLIRTAKA